MRSGRRRNVRVSGRQQFELHLVKGKILRGRKGKGLKREGRTGRRNEREGQLHMANVFSALTHAWTDGMGAPLLHLFKREEGAY